MSSSLIVVGVSRVFLEATGRSPYRYVNEMRLDWARQLVDEGRLGVAAVSRTVGYTSVSHFIKEFRRRFGATPGHYAGAHTLRAKVRSLPPTPGQPCRRGTAAG